MDFPEKHILKPLAYAIVILISALREECPSANSEKENLDLLLSEEKSFDCAMGSGFDIPFQENPLQQTVIHACRNEGR